MAATTARAAVVTLNRSLADEFTVDGITVNTLATGWIATTTMLEEVGRMARERGMAPDALLQRLTKSIPVGRAGDPQEIASLAVYLAPPGRVTWMVALFLSMAAAIAVPGS